MGLHYDELLETELDPTMLIRKRNYPAWGFGSDKIGTGGHVWSWITRLEQFVLHVRR